MSFLIINLILLLIILILLIVLSMVWPPDSPWAPWWRTGDDKAREILKFAKVTKEDVVYELGSGEGRVLIMAAKEFGAKGVGIEIDPLRAFISKILLMANGVSSKVKIIRGNFFEKDLSQASVVFVYLVPKTLNRLKPKFFKELKPGTRIVSYRYEMDLPLKESSKQHQLYLYKIN